MALRLPILPVYERDAARESGFEATVERSVLDLQQVLLVDSGSSAIGLALELSALPTDCEVLVPAYNCPTMVSPITERGWQAVFYGLKKNLQVDIESVTDCLTNRSGAMLVPHFFGIRQELSEIRQLCDERGIVLIEDCAHRFFGDASEGVPGAEGDYAIASATKFFPVADGGCLASAQRRLSTARLHSLGFKNELRAVLDLCEVSARYRRMGPWNPVILLLGAAKSGLKKLFSRTAPNSEGQTPAGEERGPVAAISAMSRVSERLMLRSDLGSIRAARKRNFSLLHSLLGDRPGFSALPGAVAGIDVPYVYPVICDVSDTYRTLREERWPVWRWDHSDPGCPVSRHYAQHLLQLPCHQSLRTSDVRVLANAVIAAREKTIKDCRGAS